MSQARSHLDDPLLDDISDVLSEELPTLSQEDIASAKQLLNELIKQITPWEGWETAVAGLIALGTGLASAASAPYLATRVATGDLIRDLMSPATREILEYLTTPAAAIPAGFLSARANLAAWMRFLRSSGLSFEDIVQILPPLIATALSAPVSANINWNALKYLKNSHYAPVRAIAAPVRTAATVLRGVSALGTNGIFAERQYVNALRFCKRKEKSIGIDLISDVKKKLKGLAKTDPDGYINILSESDLFKHLIRNLPKKANHDVQEIRQIVQSLLAIAGEPELEAKETASCATTTVMAAAFATIASTPYFRSGMLVGHDLFGMDESNSILILGVILGLSSVLVNAAITAVAMSEAFEDIITICKTKTNRDSTIQCSQVAMGSINLAIQLYLVLGYSLTNAGMALEYPPIDNQIVRWAGAALNFFANLCVGRMAYNGFITQVQDGCKRNLLKDAINSNESLADYYDNLGDGSADPTQNQLAFIKVLQKYLNSAFETLTGYLYSTKEEIIGSTIGDLLDQYKLDETVNSRSSSSLNHP